MYDVVFKFGYWWVAKDGELLTELGKFIDPISPKIIVDEVNDELQL